MKTDISYFNTYQKYLKYYNPYKKNRCQHLVSSVKLLCLGLKTILVLRFYKVTQCKGQRNSYMKSDHILNKKHN